MNMGEEITQATIEFDKKPSAEVIKKLKRMAEFTDVKNEWQQNTFFIQFRQKRRTDKSLSDENPAWSIVNYLEGLEEKETNCSINVESYFQTELNEAVLKARGIPMNQIAELGEFIELEGKTWLKQTTEDYVPQEYKNRQT